MFDKFTNLYELSKTLRFELKPVGETEKMLEENNVFEKDEIIQKKYQKTKIYFDRLHRDFVKEALANAKLSGLEKYYEALKNVRKITRETSNKDRKNLETILEKEEKRLRKEIVTLFNTTAKIWATEKYVGLKNKDLKILDEEAVFSAILKEKYWKEKETFIEVEKKDKDGNICVDENGEVLFEEYSIFDEWKGFTGYFTKFFETRKNFYKDDGTSTALATRIVDQNLRRFVENVEIISFIQKNYPDFLFWEIEKEYGFNIEKVCDFNFYTTNCLLQDGIDKYNKEFVGKIKSEINFYRQKNKGKKVPYLKTLDRQILSEKEKFIDEIEDDIRLKEVLQDLLKTGKEKTKVLKSLFNSFVNNQESFDLTKIYFSKKGFEQISRKWTFETSFWEVELVKVFKIQEKKTLKKKEGGGFSFPDFIPLDYLKQSLENLLIKTKKEEEKTEIFWKEKYQDKINKEGEIWDQFLEIFQLEFQELLLKTIQTNQGEKVIGYEVSVKNLEKLLNLEKFENNPELKIIVKEFADSLLSIYQFSKYFSVEKSKKWDNSVTIDDEFYSHLEYGFLDKYYQDSFERIITPYNLLRNYLTKKPWESVQKWKLNFENATLAGGWDKNKETANFAIILRKKGKYFLGLMKKGCNHLFTDKNKDKYLADLENGSYEKMVYKFFPDQAKMFPKVCFSKKWLDFFKPSNEIYKIYKDWEFKKGETFSIVSMQKLINFYKDCLVKYHWWQCYNFSNLKSTEKYIDNIGEFYSDVAKNGYKIFFQNISEKYIEEKNKQGELYLFQIKNKDWNLKEGKEKTGTKNLHTMYFENLFSEENIAKNFILKLNGQAEIFYRPKVSAEKLGYKQDKQGNEVVNHKRYNKNKTFFHLPMNLNRGKGKAFYFNRNLNNFLANNSEINIIGVDRGEKHLAYYSVINQKQEILQDKDGNPISGSLNFIQSKTNNGDIILKNGKKIEEIRNHKNEIIDYKIVETGEKVEAEDYKLLLEYKEKKRRIQRQTWQTVEGIKDLKKGYISQVVRKLADLAIEYNAIIVFEDLNMRFKQIRGGIEKSVYQQLEKALIEKLNFLVNKGEKNPEQAGHLLKAYQLTDQFNTFKEMGKQTGILFYTTASYTSKIDPVTGWRPNLYLKKWNAKINKENILKFSKIEFVNNLFEFTYDLEKFRQSKEAKLPQNTKWTICSRIERFRRNKNLNNNKGGYDHYEDLTDDFKKLFSKFGIDIKGDILEQIRNLETVGNEKFFSDFIFLFGLICQIRNTNPNKKGDDNDFILSPVKPFFDSRKENGKNLPKNGDDNGAFNIARKGVIILQRISEWQAENEYLEQEGKKGKASPDLFVSNQDWDNFIQK